LIQATRAAGAQDFAKKRRKQVGIVCRREEFVKEGIEEERERERERRERPDREGAIDKEALRTQR
jgi:hypothetical protein